MAIAGNEEKKSVWIRIKIPNELREELEYQAESEGMTLQALLLDALEEAAAENRG